MTREIELKLTIPPGHIKAIAQLPILSSLSIAPPKKQKLYSIYYDTPDLSLRNQRCSLRIRRIGKQWIQTIKSGGNITAGLHQHNESEIPLNKAQPDLDHLQQTGVITLAQQRKIIRTLKPIFITQFTRDTHTLQTKDGSIIEFCLDHGKITADHLNDSIHEIELELKSGNSAQLFQLALDIAQLTDFPIRLENVNKAERGYKLFTGDRTPPTKAASIEINTKTPFLDALRKTLSSCLLQLTKNENGVLFSEDPEYLHQMRVAIRRLRSAFIIFKPLLSEQHQSITFFEQELKWLMHSLSPARNWYVFANEILPSIISSCPDVEPIKVIQKLGQKQLRRYTQQVQKNLQSKRYLAFILKLNLWIYDLHHDIKLESSISIGSFSRSYLLDQHSVITKNKEKLEKMKPAALHALRIQIKKQRYAAEFFYSLYAKQECFKYYVQLLAILQGALGSINDNYMIDQQLESILSSQKQKKLARPIGVIHGWKAYITTQMKADLKNNWKEFLTMSPFQRNGQ